MHCDYSKYVKDQGIVPIIGAFIRQVAPTYSTALQIDEGNMV